MHRDVKDWDAHLPQGGISARLALAKDSQPHIPSSLSQISPAPNNQPVTASLLSPETLFKTSLPALGNALPAAAR